MKSFYFRFLGKDFRRQSRCAIAVLVIAGALFARAVAGWVAIPPRLELSSTENRRRPAATLNLSLGGMISRYDIIQRGFHGDPVAGRPHRETHVRASFEEPQSGTSVVAGWHPCNPGLLNGQSIDLMGGGEGCVDTTTSGGGILVKSLDADDSEAVQITWVLVGTNGGACTVDMERLLAQDGAMLKKVQKLRDELATHAALADADKQIAARTKATAGDRLTFVDQQGQTLAEASVDDATWVRRIKAAFHESYEQQTRQSQARVTFLILDYVLRSQRFQEEVAFAVGYHP